MDFHKKVHYITLKLFFFGICRYLQYTFLRESTLAENRQNYQLQTNYVRFKRIEHKVFLERKCCTSEGIRDYSPAWFYLSPLIFNSNND